MASTAGQSLAQKAYQRMLYILIKYVQCRECGIVAFKKSLKIPKAQSETVNRRTDNMMTKRKRTKGQTMIYKALHRKLYIKINQHEPHLKPDVNSGAPEGQAVPAALVKIFSNKEYIVEDYLLSSRCDERQITNCTNYAIYNNEYIYLNIINWGIMDKKQSIYQI